MRRYELKISYDSDTYNEETDVDFIKRKIDEWKKDSQNPNEVYFIYSFKGSLQVGAILQLNNLQNSESIDQDILCQVCDDMFYCQSLKRVLLNRGMSQLLEVIDEYNNRVPDCNAILYKSIDCEFENDFFTLGVFATNFEYSNKDYLNNFYIEVFPHINARIFGEVFKLEIKELPIKEDNAEYYITKIRKDAIDTSITGLYGMPIALPKNNSNAGEIFPTSGIYTHDELTQWLDTTRHNTKMLFNNIKRLIKG